MGMAILGKKKICMYSLSHNASRWDLNYLVQASVCAICWKRLTSSFAAPNPIVLTNEIYLNQGTRQENFEEVPTLKHYLNSAEIMHCF